MDQANGTQTMAEAAAPAPAATAPAAADATTAATGSRRRRLPLPALRWRGLPTARLPRPGRPAVGDLVFSAGAASLVLSLVFVLSEPTRARLQARSDEATIAANAATLQLAAETHAAANGGHYARQAQDLLPWLPGGQAPRNPYTGEPTLFRGSAGDLTYRPSPGGGYVIEAWGPGGARPRLLATLRSGGATKAH
jgi:hypothetical protein